MAATSDREQLRRRMRRERRRLTAAERAEAAEQLTWRVLEQPLFVRARRIAFYLAVRGEMDVTPLMEHAWRMGKHVYLPVLVPYRHNRMWFAPYRPDQPLTPNRFGIPEPAVAVREMINPRALDLALVPLVAFDGRCRRLGMGGGYYDRTFGFLRYRRSWRRPALLGVAYEFQRVARLTAASWDVDLTAVATDEAVHICRG